ncbi:phosphoserine phosphatase RsbX [Weizmannia acidilactici]|uniref:Phosphoserine phosphatase RsbX n=1 Tax=Weizmannia acidilactici TaxID=2607726 RepID=A0A5J4JLW2_9BACI|nr:PP2C family serine/threonine-protein phosphatase [Weizmannia acidilactici]GER68492.1 phosphoserine phosphatase RsbX [Weizmannia acidilactici]GER71620.1 phosphoserine phosphatase RsbX [Weizmannia acidilactici]GER74985.1 phosphoserine phosphatase RsbX [Weizmannia acidilactici]
MNYLSSKAVEVYGFQTTKAGRELCGDAYFMKATDDNFLCVLADGLGSGEYAYYSSQAVARAVKEQSDEDVEALMKACNRALYRKRGAAVAILKVCFQTRKFVYSCVGNIRFYMYSPSGRLTYPLPITGYLSGKPQHFKTETFDYESNSKFIIHSDGVKERDVKAFLKKCESIELIADQLKKQQAMDDDATFIIGRLR